MAKAIIVKVDEDSYWSKVLRENLEKVGAKVLVVDGLEDDALGNIGPGIRILCFTGEGTRIEEAARRFVKTDPGRQAVILSEERTKSRYEGQLLFMSKARPPWGVFNIISSRIAQ